MALQLEGVRDDRVWLHATPVVHVHVLRRHGDDVVLDMRTKVLGEHKGLPRVVPPIRHDVEVVAWAAKGCEILNFEGSYLGQFPLVSARFWTGDHLSSSSRRVNAFSDTIDR